MKKKVICLMLIVCMLTGCGSKSNKSSDIADLVEVESVVSEPETYKYLDVELPNVEESTTESVEIEFTAEEIDKAVKEVLTSTQGYSLDCNGMIIEIQDKVCHMYFSGGYGIWSSGDDIYVYGGEEYVHGKAIEKHEESESSSINVSVGVDPDEVKSSIKDSIGEITSVSKEEGLSYSFVSVVDDNELEGSILMNEDGTLNSIVFPYAIEGGQVQSTLSPLGEDIVIPEDALNTDIASEEELMEAIFVVMFAGSSEIQTTDETGEVESEASDKDDETEASDKNVKSEASNYYIESIDLTKDEDKYYKKDKCMNYQTYADYCKDSGIEQKYTDKDKYYFVYTFKEDCTCDVTLSKLDIDYDLSSITLDIDHKMSGDEVETAYIVIVQVDEEISGYSVSTAGTY